MGWSVAVAVSVTVALVVSMAVTVAVALPVAVGYIGFSGTIDTRREIQWSAARKMLRNSMFVLRAPSYFDFHCNPVLPKLLVSVMWTNTIWCCCVVCLRCCKQVLWMEPNPERFVSVYGEEMTGSQK